MYLLNILEKCVTFKENSNKTIEETANKNMNMNIIRKWALSILKLLDMGKKMSLKLKRFSINCKPDDYMSKIMKNQTTHNFTYIVINFHVIVLNFHNK